MKNGVSKKILATSECAIMIALAFILDYLSKGISAFFPNPWVSGGGITLASVPLIFITYRHGTGYGVLTSFAFSLLQLLSGWYAPPAGTALSYFFCVFLDYVLAFGVLGLANVFARPFGNKLLGYSVGAFTVCMLRFLCSFVSGAVIWGYVMWGFENVWAFSFVYNLSYMLPNAALSALVIRFLCKSLDPETLKPLK